MIDTDKYEGHTEGEWDLHSMGDGWTIGQLKRIDRTLMQDAPLLLQEVKRLREALINVQRSLIWDEKDRAMFDEPITLEALFTQVEQVRSDITEMIK